LEGLIVMIDLTYPVGKITKKNSLKECFFVNLALKIQYRVAK